VPGELVTFCLCIPQDPKRPWWTPIYVGPFLIIWQTRFGGHLIPDIGIENECDVLGSDVLVPFAVLEGATCVKRREQQLWDCLDSGVGA